MRRTVRVFPVLLTLTAASLPAVARAQTFEGVVSYQVTTDRGTMDLTQSYKGGKVRTEARGATMLTDPQAGTQTIIMDQQKMYMVMDLKDMAERAKGMMKNKPDTTTPKITAEGTHETIAGKTCDNYLVVTQTTREICVAKGMGNIIMGGGGMGPGGQGGQGMDAGGLIHPEYAEFFKQGFFPLKMSDVEGTNKKVKLLATKVEPKSLDASLFTVPAGYTEFAMPTMPGHHRR